MYSLGLAIFIGLNLLTSYILKDVELFLVVMKLFNIFEFTVIAFFIYNVLKAPLFRKVVLYSIVPFILYAIIDYFANDRFKFNNHSNIVGALLIIIFIVYFFYEKMNTVVMYPLYQSTNFWICVGLLLYFAGSFFFVLFIKSTVDKVLMTSIYALVVIVKNILLSLSLFASEEPDNNDNSLQIPKDLDLDEMTLTNPNKF